MNVVRMVRSFVNLQLSSWQYYRRTRPKIPMVQYYLYSSIFLRCRCALRCELCLHLVVFLILFFCFSQVGCCKPPVQCGFTMKNATFWEVPKTGPAMNDTDCFTWKNKENKLCYDCNSCKGEVLANIRNQWRYLTIFNVCVLILLTSIYVLGCYAIRNNRRNQHLVYHPYGINR